jgi:hypothetical protein
MYHLLFNPELNYDSAPHREEALQRLALIVLTHRVNVYRATKVKNYLLEHAQYDDSENIYRQAKEAACLNRFKPYLDKHCKNLHDAPHLFKHLEDLGEQFNQASLASSGGCPA